MQAPKFYITTPIFYPNGVPHIGHAYTAIATDVLARFQRLDGKDVFFLTGTDEHGQKMQQTAEKEGITPIELADRNSAVFRDMVETLGCSNDDFIRTTEERHRIVRARSSGGGWRPTATSISASYAGWYSVRQEAYFDESETTVGEDGVRREPLGSPVEWVEEESYYLPPVRLSGQAAGALRGASRLRRPGRAPQRGGELRQGRPARTCRSRARPSTGAFRCPATTSTSCMSGSTR